MAEKAKPAPPEGLDSDSEDGVLDRLPPHRTA